MNRNTLILIAVLVVLAAIGLSVYSRSASVEEPLNATSTPVAPISDAPEAIDRDLESIDTGADMDADIRSTDADIQQL